MAEETVKDLTETNAATEDMDLVGGENENDSATNGDSKSKRAREETEEKEEDEEKNDAASKKQKVDGDEKSVEEERLEKKLDGAVEEEAVDPVGLGPKKFSSSVEMFDYFYKLLHNWSTHVNVNKYEYLVLLDLIKKGHAEPDKKIGKGIQAFQVRFHPTYKSRCFFILREDESAPVDDFSFRKCVDHILPLPQDMKPNFDGNKASGGGGRGRGGRGGGRGGHGRGRGGKWRN